MGVDPLTFEVVNDALTGVPEPMPATTRHSPMISTGD